MSSSPIKAPKGTRDLFGPEVQMFTQLEHVARHVFHLYDFKEVRTPIFESIDLFARSLGATSDVVEKEMFAFQDRGERHYALRPEGTAGVVRHYIEHNLSSQGGSLGLYYMGPMFRGERPQAGRYRQFWQIGSEYFGSSEPSSDADTVMMATQIFQDMGISRFTVQVNSLGCSACRPQYRDALFEYLKDNESILTEESRRRMLTNPLRVLDSKVDGPKLGDAPTISEFLCEACRKHHDQFLSFLGQSTALIEHNPRLVRGLDYYVRSVFEFVSPDLGAQSALAAGGRYDGLVQSLGGAPVPGVGFALGMDRVVDVAIKKGLENTSNSSQVKSAVVIALDERAHHEAYKAAADLRKAHVNVAPLQLRKKMKTLLADASNQNIGWAILIGEDELKTSQVALKDLKSRTQERMSLSDAIKRILLC